MIQRVFLARHLATQLAAALLLIGLFAALRPASAADDAAPGNISLFGSQVLSAYRDLLLAEGYAEGRKLVDAVRQDPGRDMDEDTAKALLVFIDYALRLGDTGYQDLLPAIEKALASGTQDSRGGSAVPVLFIVIEAHYAQLSGRQAINRAQLQLQGDVDAAALMQPATQAALAAIEAAAGAKDPVLMQRAEIVALETEGFSRLFEPGNAARIIDAGRQMLDNIARKLEPGSADLEELAYLHARLARFILGAMAPPDVTHEDRLAFGLEALAALEELGVREKGALQGLRAEIAASASRLDKREIVDAMIAARARFWAAYSWDPGIDLDAAQYLFALGTNEDALAAYVRYHEEFVRDMPPDDPQRGDRFLDDIIIVYRGLEFSDAFIARALANLLQRDDLLPKTNPSRRRVIARLMKTYERTGEIEKARALGATLDEVPFPPEVAEALDKAERGEISYKDLHALAMRYDSSGGMDSRSQYQLFLAAAHAAIEQVGLLGGDEFVSPVLSNYSQAAGALQRLGRLDEAKALMLELFDKLKQRKDYDNERLHRVIVLLAGEFEDWGDQRRAEAIRTYANMRAAAFYSGQTMKLWVAPGEFPIDGWSLFNRALRRWGDAGNRAMPEKFMAELLSTAGDDEERVRWLAFEYADWLEDTNRTADADLLNGQRSTASVRDVCRLMVELGGKHFDGIECGASVVAARPEPEESEAVDFSDISRFLDGETRSLTAPASIMPGNMVSEMDRHTQRGPPELARNLLSELESQQSFVPVSQLTGLALQFELDGNSEDARSALVAALAILERYRYRHAAMEAQVLDTLATVYELQGLNISAELRLNAVDRLLDDQAYFESGLEEIALKLVSHLLRLDRETDAVALIARIRAEAGGDPAETAALAEKLDARLSSYESAVADVRMLTAAAAVREDEFLPWALDTLRNNAPETAERLLLASAVDRKVTGIVRAYAETQDTGGVLAQLGAVRDQAAESLGADHPVTAYLGLKYAAWLSLESSVKQALPVLQAAFASASRADRNDTRFAHLFLRTAIEYLKRAVDESIAAAGRLDGHEKKLVELLSGSDRIFNMEEFEALNDALADYGKAFEFARAAEFIGRLERIPAGSDIQTRLRRQRLLSSAAGRLSLSCRPLGFEGLDLHLNAVQTDCALVVEDLMTRHLKLAIEGWRGSTIFGDEVAPEEVRGAIVSEAGDYISQLTRIMNLPQGKIERAIANGLVIAEIHKFNPTDAAARSFAVRQKLEEKHPGSSRLLRDYRRAALQLRQLEEELTGAGDGEPDEALVARVEAARATADRARRQAADFLPAFLDGQLRVEIDLQAVQAALGDKDAAVAYYDGGGANLVWIVRHDRIRVVELNYNAETLERRISRLRADLDFRSDDLSVDVAGAHAIYRDILAPLERELDGVERIFLSPNAALAHVPFTALVSRQPQDARWLPTDDWRPDWVIDRFDLAVISSIALLPELRNSHYDAADKGELLAAGNPYLEADKGTRTAGDLVFSGGATDAAVLQASFQALPDAAAEVEQAIEVFTGRAAPAVTGAEFSERWIKSADLTPYRYLLFATHARAESHNAPAFLLFSPAGDQAVHDEGALTADELRLLNLAADVVVLSACRTGPGFGHIGGFGQLVSALNEAGARNVIATHWRVASDVAAAVTVPLMKHLAVHGPYGLPDALNRIERDMSRRDDRLRHPAYWAAFFLIGAPPDAQ